MLIQLPGSVKVCSLVMLIPEEKGCVGHSKVCNAPIPCVQTGNISVQRWHWYAPNSHEMFWQVGLEEH